MSDDGVGAGFEQMAVTHADRERLGAVETACLDLDVLTGE